MAAAARRVAAGWDRAGARTGASLGFDTALLVDAVDRQGAIEALAGPGTSVLEVTEPAETATAAAFAHTAVLAGRPQNAAPLAEAGRLFGRLAHLLDAVEDRAADAASGAWNPLTATGTGLQEARRLCDDAVHGVRLALREAEFTDGKLAHVLLAHELGRSVDRTFGTAGCGHQAEAHAYGPPPVSGSSGPYGSNNPYGGGHGAPGMPGPPGGPGGTPPGPPGFTGDPHRPGRPARRGFWAGCAVAIELCCTCKLCCAERYEGPWSRKQREGCCHKCDCCDCCDCCPCDGC